AVERLVMALVEHCECACAPFAYKPREPLVAQQPPHERKLGRALNWERDIAHRSRIGNAADSWRLGAKPTTLTACHYRPLCERAPRQQGRGRRSRVLALP